MARFAYFFALAFALLFSCVMAAPLGESKRQIGDIQCNVARLKTVAGLAKSAKSIKSAIAAAGSDSATVAQLQTAAKGISSAQAGVATIATALFTGQQAPAAARQKVQDGLDAATSALGSTASADSKVTNAVSTAQSSVSGTAAAGAQVVADCK
ncbi:hypothetical protein GALMADRAFT_905540 [Galerina marginata CBS 339.88]|uniref:Cell wall protein n=1 Tax=Galerina marginata (strain CBS 339.88) TaxID=685588 RepID=A0A067SQY1_GALM3|nr:hypothetical protein GALMADRAFT_905540 [Galerina marginata CBS 339.88]